MTLSDIGMTDERLREIAEVARVGRWHVTEIAEQAARLAALEAARNALEMAAKWHDHQADMYSRMTGEYAGASESMHSNAAFSIRAIAEGLK